MKVEKISAFSYENRGGNPAGVLFTDEMLSDNEMLKIAKEVNYSETAFLYKDKQAYNIRYFSPEREIAFCGHATIASGYSLGKKIGLGQYNLKLGIGEILLNVEKIDEQIISTIHSAKTDTFEPEELFLKNVIAAFNFDETALDKKFPIKIAYSGNKHLIIFVKNKKILEQMDYDFEIMKVLMQKNEIVTISILWQEKDDLFHARNAFAYGGVFEDPATGSAAIALGEYLRSTGIKKSGQIEILQGFDMKQPSQLFVSFTKENKSSIKVSGKSRII